MECHVNVNVNVNVNVDVNVNGNVNVNVDVQLFGCDFVVDEDLQPWFLEVNTGPLLNTKQYEMLCDTARIVFYNQPPDVRAPNVWLCLTATGVECKQRI